VEDVRRCGEYGSCPVSLFAKEIKKVVGDRLLVSSVGSIMTGELTEQIIGGGGEDDASVPLDLIAACRVFHKNPGLVWAWAEELETTIQLAQQLGWGFKGRKKGTSQNVV
jgi:2,4-dienoyl-CoA reductase-like NADH-dependent reductase (Old Yellow Enzyme family)